ncbi:dicentracin-like [Gambusia affinis]|uniref:dicentracin-like n=1 Tax=Gambusia affinis TaxID=33528 RepID=UPI001CDD4316|nr:dicentracin-like [Gambusia affinis]
MKCTTLFLVLSMVVLMAQPGECIFGWIIKGVSHVVGHIHRAIHGKGKVAEEQADQQQLDQDQLDRQQLDQDQLDRQQLDQDQLDQDQLDQEDLDKQQLDKRSYQSAHRRFD